MGEKIVIVGAGHAAGQVITLLKQKKYAGEIILIGEESYLPYQRPPLSKKFLANKLAIDRLYLKPTEFYDDSTIKKYLDTKVISINRKKKNVELSNGEEVSYNKLVLSVGSRVRRLNINSPKLHGIHYLRKIDDVISIKSELNKKKNIVIIGGGYIGLETAAVTRELGHNVTVLEKDSRLLSRVVSPEISDFFEIEHARNGVKLKLSTSVIDFYGDKRIESLKTSNGEIIPADIVIIGIGIKPNFELAEDANLKVNNGIIVNDVCQTSDSNIYAVGDCTIQPNEIYNRNIRLESVQNALEQAKIAVGNICGENKTKIQVPWFWSDQFDLKLQIAGLSDGYDKTIVIGKPSDRSFACLYFKNNRLIAADAINAASEFIMSKKLIASKKTIDTDKLENKTIDLKDLIEGE